MENLTLKLRLRRYLHLVTLHKYNQNPEYNMISTKRAVHFWLAHHMVINNGYDIFNFSLSELNTAIHICQQYLDKKNVDYRNDFLLNHQFRNLKNITTAGGYHVATAH